MSELKLRTSPNGFSDQVLANNIRFYRKKLGLKPQELADKVYISNGRQIYKWESGEARPGYESLVNLCKVFGVTTDTLLGFVRPNAIPDALPEAMPEVVIASSINPVSGTYASNLMA